MPYELSWLVTRLIAVRDFLMVCTGKFGGLKLLEFAFSTDKYSSEDIRYIKETLRSMSAKTIWRTFESCNNYHVSTPVNTDCEKIEYWYSKRERRERQTDIRYAQRHLPNVVFKMFGGVGHGGLPVLKPHIVASGMRRLIHSL